MQENNRGGERPKIAPKPTIPSKPRYVPPIKIQQKIIHNESTNLQRKEPKPLHKELNRTRDLYNFPQPQKTEYKELSMEKSDFITDFKHIGIETNIKYDAYASTYLKENGDKFSSNLEPFKKVEDISQKTPQSPSTVCCSILSNATTECCGIININKKQLNEKAITKVDSVDSNSSDSGGFKDFKQLDLTKRLSPDVENKAPEPNQVYQRNISQPDVKEKRSDHKQYTHDRKSSMSDYKFADIRLSVAQNKQNYVANAQALVQFLPQTEQQYFQKPIQNIEKTENFHQHIAKFTSNVNKTEEIKTKPKPLIKQGQFQQSTKKLEEMLSQRSEKDQLPRKSLGYLADGESSQDIEQKMFVQKQIQQKLQADLQQTVKQIQEIQSIELRLPQNRKWSESNRSQPAIGLKHTPKSRVSNSLKN
uniref:Uncharacterized protein LOC114347647 n=1 Tax=Diabrotica virgifera virgifera TaxID=50390 RepID=A0A6P7GXD1_DIAVI